METSACVISKASRELTFEYLQKKNIVEAIKKLFLEDDLEKMHAHSYEKAKEYLASEVETKWKNLTETI